MRKLISALSGLALAIIFTTFMFTKIYSGKRSIEPSFRSVQKGRSTLVDHYAVSQEQQLDETAKSNLLAKFFRTPLHFIE